LPSVPVSTYINSRSNFDGDSRLTEFEIQARLEVSTSAFGDLQNKAIALLMLHWLTLDDRDSTGTGIGGSIKEEKEGMLSREFLLDFSLTKKYPDLTQTRWGLELLRIRNITIVNPINRFSKV